MRPARRHATRRAVVVGSTAVLAASMLLPVGQASARQMDRDLIDLLANQKQTQIAHYGAILEAFDDDAFAAAGLPDNTRTRIEEILAAEVAHLAVVTRPDAATTPLPAALIPEEILEALREVARMENLAVASYAFVIAELGRERLIPELLGIHSVEARHAAWLATLLGDEPFPDAIDAPLSLEAPAPDMESGETPDNSQPAGTPAASPAAGAEVDIAPIIDIIARDLGIVPDDITVLSVTPEVWPDSSLGCPQPDMLYAQVLTPGYQVVVEIEGAQVEFHTDERGTVVRCP